MLTQSLGIFYHQEHTHVPAPDTALPALMRRMSPLQKAVTFALSTFKDAHPLFWQEWVLSGRCRVYYASAYGEAQLMCQLTKQVQTQDFPLSPRDFQNSVHNAAPAYASMATGLDRGMLVGSSGFLSADRTLHLLRSRIVHGLEPLGLLIHAHGLEAARAELFLLGEKTWKGDPSLPQQGSIETVALVSPEDRKQEQETHNTTCFEEETNLVAWLSPSFKARGWRRAHDHSGHGVVSLWS